MKNKSKVFIHRDEAEGWNKLICRKCSCEVAIQQNYCHGCGEHLVEGSYGWE